MARSIMPNFHQEAQAPGRPNLHTQVYQPYPNLSQQNIPKITQLHLQRKFTFLLISLLSKNASPLCMVFHFTFSQLPFQALVFTFFNFFLPNLAYFPGQKSHYKRLLEHKYLINVKIFSFFFFIHCENYSDRNERRVSSMLRRFPISLSSTFGCKNCASDSYNEGF